MVIFLLTIFVWFACLFFLRPNPSDLQAKIPSYWESFKKIKATFWLGIFLILVFFIFSGGTFIDINEDWFAILGVNNVNLLTPWWFIQAFTHNFVHINLLHLLVNLTFLGMLSLYERKVSAGRFLAVFLFGGVLSSTSMFLMFTPTVSAGASAGLFALAGAYLLDTPGLTRKDYILGLGMIVFLFLVLSFSETRKSAESLNFEIDFWGHAFGLIFGIVFCKLFPRKVVTVF